MWVLLITSALVACGPGPAPPPAPSVDAEQVILAAENRSALDGAYRVVFDWTASEPDARFNGRGVARLEAPYRARLDLFTGNGEGVASAALVEDDLRGTPGQIGPLPPPALFWGALGIFRPGRTGNLQGARAHRDGTTEVIYRYPGTQEVRYRLRDGNVERVELLRGGQLSEEVTLRRNSDGRFPTEATYRHLAERRELRLTLDTTEHVESFPPDIWNPGS